MGHVTARIQQLVLLVKLQINDPFFNIYTYIHHTLYVSIVSGNHGFYQYWYIVNELNADIV